MDPIGSVWGMMRMSLAAKTTKVPKQYTVPTHITVYNVVYVYAILLQLQI